MIYSHPGPWISEIPLTPERLHDIHFLDANQGFAVGRQGVIIRYSLQTGQDETMAAGPVEISVWPNPFRDKLTIDLNGNMTDSKELKLYNATGHLVSHTEPSSGVSSVTIGTSELPSGLYILTLLDGSNQVRSVKIIKE